MKANFNKEIMYLKKYDSAKKKLDSKNYQKRIHDKKRFLVKNVWRERQNEMYNKHHFKGINVFLQNINFFYSCFAK